MLPPPCTPLRTLSWLWKLLRGNACACCHIASAISLAARCAGGSVRSSQGCGAEDGVAEAAANAAAKAKRDAEAAADRAFMQREEAELRMAAQAKEEAEEAQRVEAAEKSRLEAEQRMAEVRHR